MRSFTIAMTAFFGFAAALASILTLVHLAPNVAGILLIAYPSIKFTLFVGDVADNFTKRRGWKA